MQARSFTSLMIEYIKSFHNYPGLIWEKSLSLQAEGGKKSQLVSALMSRKEAENFLKQIQAAALEPVTMYRIVNSRENAQKYRVLASLAAFDLTAIQKRQQIIVDFLNQVHRPPMYLWNSKKHPHCSQQWEIDAGYITYLGTSLEYSDDDDPSGHEIQKWLKNPDHFEYNETENEIEHITDSIINRFCKFLKEEKRGKYVCAYKLPHHPFVYNELYWLASRKLFLKVVPPVFAITPPEVARHLAFFVSPSDLNALARINKASAEAMHEELNNKKSRFK
jgi:hypothetical protein